MQIPGREAWRQAATAETARWTAARISGDVVSVAFRPKFKIKATDSFFCIGSCFARNIEEHLIYRGLTVLSRKLFSPSSEWPARTNGLVNKFTTFSILNEVEWLLDPPNIDASMFAEARHGWLDLQLSPGATPTSLKRCVERRAYLNQDYFQRIRGADVIIITLGLNEAWRDLARGFYLNATPAKFTVNRDPSRFRAEITDVAGNVDALDRIIATLETLNPSVRIILTVSPVPLTVTFSGRDVVSANAYSKSVLLCAAQVIAQRNNVDYFPSYEMVTMADRTSVFAQDCIHVNDSAVAQVISHFTQAHDLPPPEVQFNEMGYLAANPDVEEAVRRADYDSGFHHWKLYGREEGRALMPETPTPYMIKGGAV